MNYDSFVVVWPRLAPLWPLYPSTPNGIGSAFSCRTYFINQLLYQSTPFQSTPANPLLLYVSIYQLIPDIGHYLCPHAL